MFGKKIFSFSIKVILSQFLLLTVIFLQSCSTTEIIEDESNAKLPEYDGLLVMARESYFSIKDFNDNTIKSMNIVGNNEIRSIFWSNDGADLIITYSTKNKTDYRIAIIDTRTYKFTELRDFLGAPLRGFAQSYHPTENKILYIVDTLQSYREINEFDLTSKTKKNIIKIDPAYEILYACWSPDGKHISITCNKDVQCIIFLANTDGTQLKEIYSVSYQTLSKNFWSPNNKFLLMMCFYQNPPRYRVICLYDYENNTWKLVYSTLHDYNIRVDEVLGWDKSNQNILFLGKDTKEGYTNTNLYLMNIQTSKIIFVKKRFVTWNGFYSLYLKN